MEAFKARLKLYKKELISSGTSSLGHFWDLSEILLSKINDHNHDVYAQFMSDNPKIAKYKGINVRLDSSNLKSE